MITWNKKWIKKYESPWSILSKLCLSNKANGYDILHYVFHKTSNEYSIINYKYGILVSPKFDIDVISNILGFNIEKTCMQASKELLKPFFIVIDGREELYYKIFYSSKLKYCPACISYGYHSLFHQLSFIDRCLIHDIDLIDKCPSCSGDISYKYYLKSNQHGYKCTCGNKLFYEDIVKAIQTWNKYDFNYILPLFSKYKKEKAYYISINVLQSLTDTISTCGLKALRKMALNRLDSINIKSYSSIHQSEYYFGNDTSLYNRDQIIPDLLYKESLKIVKHYIKKHYRIRSSTLCYYNEKGNRIYINYVLNNRSNSYKYREIEKANRIFDIYSYAYFLWLRESEIYRYDYYNYNIFEKVRKKLNGNNQIDRLIDMMSGRIFQCCGKNFGSLNLYSNIIMRIAILLFLNRFDQWVSKVVDSLVDHEHKLDVIINNEYYKPEIFYDLEFLIITNTDSYKLYTITNE